MRWAFATMGRRTLRSFAPMGRGTHAFEGTHGFGEEPQRLGVGRQHDRTIDRSVEQAGSFLGREQLEALGLVSVGIAASSGVGVVAGIGPLAAVQPETSCEERMLQLVQDDVCSMCPGKLGCLLKQTSTCLDCSARPLGNGSPSTDGECGRTE